MAPRTPLPATLTARRIRAAIAYSLKENREIEKAVKDVIPASTFKRITAIKNPRAASKEEREAIADACGVPHAFMEDGFAALEHNDERLVTELLARVQSLEAQAELADAAEKALRNRIAALEGRGRRGASGET